MSMKPFQNILDKNEELEHHGIIGMKWGVRRYQNKDGSLTPAGKKRYDVDIDGAKSDLIKAKKDRSKTNSSTIDEAKINKANANVYLKRQKLKEEKAKDALNQIDPNRKSKHRIALEQKYREQGLSEQEAEIAAQKRIRTEQIIAASAAVTVAAIAGTAIYKHRIDVSEEYIKKGDILQRYVSGKAALTKDLHEGNYFSRGAHDDKRYAGLLPSHFNTANLGRKTIVADKDIRIASYKTSREVFNNALDSSSRKDLSEFLKSNGHFKEARSVANGQISKSAYNCLNRELQRMPNNLKTTFFTSMSNAGYDAIKDVNDRRFSGYLSKTAAIITNTSNMHVSEVKTIIPSAERQAVEKGKIFSAQIAKTWGSFTLATVGLATVSSRISEKGAASAIVDKYKKEHPNTQMSDQEILESYYRKGG